MKCFYIRCCISVNLTQTVLLLMIKKWRLETSLKLFLMAGLSFDLFTAIWKAPVKFIAGENPQITFKKNPKHSGCKCHVMRYTITRFNLDPNLFVWISLQFPPGLWWRWASSFSSSLSAAASASAGSLCWRERRRNLWKRRAERTASACQLWEMKASCRSCQIVYKEMLSCRVVCDLWLQTECVSDSTSWFQTSGETAGV